MVSRRTNETSKNKTTRRRPATTPEGLEDQMISLAVSLAEKQLEAGTASAQVITHYLKMGSTRERLEQERIARENQLLQAKTEAAASQQRVEEMYSRALNAMRSYSGQEPLDNEDEFDD